MKILFINTTYNIGSTGKLTKNFLDYVYSLGNEVFCVFANGKTPGTVGAVRVKTGFTRKLTIFLERLTGRIGSFSPIATMRVCRFIDRINPSIIYLGNLHGYYINIFALYGHIKKRRIPCVQIMWDEFPMTGSCSFSFDCTKFKTICMNCPRLKDYPSSWFFDTSTALYKKKKVSYNYDRLSFISVPYTITNARQSSLLSKKLLYPVDEAIDQETLFYPRNADRLRKELGIPINNKVILTVAVYPNERKGCKYYLETARLLEAYNDITFVHVGFIADTSECPSNYIPIGFVNDQILLAEYYSLADLFICTSFAETQPNTCLEALSCGTRICGFNISGIPTCADPPFGQYVTPGNSEELSKIVLDSPLKTDHSISETRKYAESRFSSREYCKRLFEVGLSLINS